MTKIVFLVSEDWYFLLHHLPVALACKARGWEVVVATHVNTHAKTIEGHGLILEPIPFDRGGLNPLRELRCVWTIVKMLHRHKPDLVEAINLKPVLDGALANLLAGRPPLVAAILGLGYVFTAKTAKARLLGPPLTWALKLLLRANHAWLVTLNQDDRAWMIGHGIVEPDRASVLGGIGVDLGQFIAWPDPPSRPPVFAIVCRMLRDKGVPETVEAARQLHKEGVALQLWLIGIPDPENPSSLTEAELRAWQEAGDAEWRGFVADIPGLWRKAHVAILPSHREGLPTALIEAAACGRPIVTSDAVGCRDVVDDGVEGFVVPVRNAKALAEAMRKLAEDEGLRTRMGQAARQRAEARYGRDVALAAQFAVFEAAMAERR